MKTIIAGSFSFALILASFHVADALSPVRASPTHCSSDEIAYFSCSIKGSGKIASLCGSKLPGANGSYL